MGETGNEDLAYIVCARKLTDSRQQVVILHNLWARLPSSTGRVWGTEASFPIGPSQLFVMSVSHNGPYGSLKLLNLNEEPIG